MKILQIAKIMYGPVGCAPQSQLWISVLWETMEEATYCMEKETSVKCSMRRRPRGFKLNTHGSRSFTCQSWIKANQRDNEDEYFDRIKCVVWDRQIFKTGNVDVHEYCCLLLSLLHELDAGQLPFDLHSLSIEAY